MTRDGYSNMVFFPEDFPWKNKSLKEMLGPKFLKVQSQPAQGLVWYRRAAVCRPFWFMVREVTSSMAQNK